MVEVHAGGSLEHHGYIGGSCPTIRYTHQRTSTHGTSCTHTTTHITTTDHSHGGEKEWHGHIGITTHTPISQLCPMTSCT